jgi:hypothetical protein
VSQPAVSRILSAFTRLRERQRDDHSSRPGIADGLKRPTRRLRTGRPLIRRHPPSPFGYGATSARHRPPIWSCSVRGFACHLPYSRRGALLPHLFTLTRLRPSGYGAASLGACRAEACEASVGGRYIFCATGPSGCPDRALPGALPSGVRTFLSPCGKRSSSRLRRSSLSHSGLPTLSTQDSFDSTTRRLPDSATLEVIRPSPAESRTARASCRGCFSACR